MEFTSEGSRFYQNDHILTCTADGFIRSGVYSGLGLPFQKVATGKTVLNDIETDTYRLTAPLTPST